MLYTYIKHKKKAKRKCVTLFDAPSQTAQFRRHVRTPIFDALKVQRPHHKTTQMCNVMRKPTC